MLGYLDQGGHVLVVGDIGPAGAAVGQIISHEGTRRIGSADFSSAVLGDRQVTLTGIGDAAVNIQRTQRDTAALHIIRYIQGGVARPTAVPASEDVALAVRLPYASSSAVYVAPQQPDQVLAVTVEGTTARVILPNLGQYGIVEFLR